MDRSHHARDVTRSGGQVCWAASVAGMGEGWRPVLAAVGKPSNPQNEVPELSGHWSEASAPMDAGAGNVPVVNDRPPRRPRLTVCVGRTVQLRADRWAEGELTGSFDEATQDDLAGVAGDRCRQGVLTP